MDGLNYHHLLYFWTVARTGSIAKASLELGLTQPTISEQLRLLEKSLGHKLFDRAGRSLVLTEKGSTVLQYAEKIFALGNELTAAVSETLSVPPQKLRIAIAPEVSAAALAETLRPLAKLAPAPAVFVFTEASERAIAMLLDGKIDVVFSLKPELLKNSPGAHRHLLLECGLAFTGTHAAPGRFPKSLHEQPLLLPPEPMRSQLLRWLKMSRVVMYPAAEIQSAEVALAFAQNGAGVAVVPDLPALRSAKLKFLGRTEAVRWRLYAYTAEKRPRNHALTTVLSRAAK